MCYCINSGIIKVGVNIVWFFIIKNGYFFFDVIKDEGRSCIDGKLVGWIIGVLLWIVGVDRSRVVG